MVEVARTRSGSIRRKAKTKASRRRQKPVPATEWIGWTEVGLIFLVLCLAVGYALLLTNIRSEVVQFGYGIRQLADRADELQLEVNKLRLKQQALRSPENLEKLAKKMNLAKPETNQIVVVHDF